MNILEKIADKTKERVEILKKDFNLKEKALSIKNEGFIFEKALKKEDVAIIAEIKKASPSKGLICKDFHPNLIADEYKNANVDCISVLTEPYFFLGDNSYVQIVKNISKKPVLRKDFIIDEIQIYESKIIGANCILLICSLLDETKLSKFLKIAEDLNLSALVEAHSEDEIKTAIKANARIIGVNNRNLKTFEVDFNNSLKLRKLVPSDILFVSESGIKTRDDIIKLQNANVNAALIGETFMRSENKIAEIKKLRGEIWK